MVTPITPQINPQVNPPKPTKTSIFYINDVHSNIVNLEKLKSASDEFDAFVPSEGVDKLKLSAGDVGVGRDKNFNKLAVDFQNSTGIMASAVGNHELDLNKQDLVDILKEANYKFLGMNVELPEDTSVNKKLRKDIINSYVQEKNGEKYGIIGLAPFDLHFHLSDPEEYADMNILQIDKTIPLLQNEVDKLREQGVDKIILLSHAGMDNDMKMAQSVEGVDVILGGHTHDFIKGIEEGKNLFYSKKTGEPTIITQAGKNGNHFGILNLEFNENGVITKVQNNTANTEDFPRSSIMKNIIDSVIGKPKVIGQIKSNPHYKQSLLTENPNANFITDIERKELGVDMVLINSGNFRANLEQGELTDRDLKILTPFDNKVWILKLTEKEIIDGLKNGAKALAAGDEDHSGIVQCSGLKYTISKSGKIKSATFLDAKGNEISIDVNNPNPFKTYTIGTDDYIAKGGCGYFSDKENAVITKFNFDKNKLIEDYLKKHSEPVEIKTDGRIMIVD